MPLVHLTDRAVIRLTGEDAQSFLNNVTTGEVLSLAPGQAGYGALLTPQGKIISDFLVTPMAEEDGGGFVLDAPVAVAPQLLQRLAMYRLRAKVTITDQSDMVAVLAGFGDHATPGEEALAYPDPRAPGLGTRYLVARDEAARLASDPMEDWLRHRIGLGVPDGGKDFAYGETFPHEALMDQLHGVSFTKGCYVGQEVVSRMQHRGTARSRIVPIRFLDGIRSDWGVDVTAGGRPIGKVGSTIGDRGLALIRLDRVQDALAAGEPILAGGLPVALERAPFIGFPMPGDPEFGTVST